MIPFAMSARWVENGNDISEGSVIDLCDSARDRKGQEIDAAPSPPPPPLRPPSLLLLLLTLILFCGGKAEAPLGDRSQRRERPERPHRLRPQQLQLYPPPLLLLLLLSFLRLLFTKSIRLGLFNFPSETFLFSLSSSSIGSPPPSFPSPTFSSFSFLLFPSLSFLLSVVTVLF